MFGVCDFPSNVKGGDGGSDGVGVWRGGGVEGKGTPEHRLSKPPDETRKLTKKEKSIPLPIDFIHEIEMR